MSLIRKCDICGRELDSTDVCYVVDENIPLLKKKQHINVCKRCMERLIEEVKDDKKQTVSADVPQWIPCNKKQPTCTGYYLVTLDFAWGKEVEMGEWFEGEWINPNSHVTVAWMPLPNPWKGE